MPAQIWAGRALAAGSQSPWPLDPAEKRVRPETFFLLVQLPPASHAVSPASPTAPPSPRPPALIAGLVLVGNPPSPVAGWLAAHSRGRLQQKENTESSLSWSWSRKQTRSLSTAAGRRSPLVSASPLAPCRIIGDDVVACIEQQW